MIGYGVVLQNQPLSDPALRPAVEQFSRRTEMPPAPPNLTKHRSRPEICLSIGIFIVFGLSGVDSFARLEPMYRCETRRALSRLALRAFVCLAVALGGFFVVPFAEAALCPGSRKAPKIRVLVEPGEAIWDDSLDPNDGTGFLHERLPWVILHALTDGDEFTGQNYLPGMDFEDLRRVAAGMSANIMAYLDEDIIAPPLDDALTGAAGVASSRAGVTSSMARRMADSPG